MLKAIGFTDDDLARPLVGVATTWIETMPCNFNQRRLAEFVKEGIRAGGGTPMEFNTIAVSDGVSMGTEGMKASLVSREVIADSIELVVRGHLLDGLVCLVGCDKTIPAAAMALARLDVPGLVLYNGTIYPGTYKGRDLTVVSVFEAVGAYRAGKITHRGAVRHRERRVPRRRRLRRPVHGEHDVDGHGVPRPLAGRPQRRSRPRIPAKDDAARRAGELAMTLVRHDVRPSSHRDPRARSRTRSPASRRPAAPRTASSTCWRSPTRWASRSTIDDFDTIAARTPIVADMRPGRPAHRVRPVRRRRHVRWSCASC